MKRFTDLYLALDGTNSTAEKTAMLVDYFDSAPDADAAWVVAFLTGNRPKGTGATGLLRDLCLRHTGHPAWLFDECRSAVGDLSETVALLLPPPASATDEPLHVVMRDRVLALIGAGAAVKERIVLDAWSVLDAESRLVYHKLIRGGFRIGVQRKTVAKALAEAGGLELDLVVHRLVGRFRPTAADFRRLLDPPSPDEHLDRPYPFFLAYGLEGPVESLGPPDDWVAEEKWDGIRAQLIIREDSIRLWSRGEESIGPMFPELVAAAQLPPGTVLDGEVVIWGEDGPRSFFELQRRLNRRVAPTTQLSLFGEESARFIAYDLLESDGADRRSESFESRRGRLERMLETHPSDVIRGSSIIPFEDWSELAPIRDGCVERGTEGLMLKRRDSIYGLGRTRGRDGWVKWEVDPFTLDAVLIGAQPGSGRRANLHTDCTFAVWDRREEPARLVTFAKAYSGLDQREIESLDRWIRTNTVARRGPFREVRPEQVFELAFEGIQRSTRHRSGLAVRFPRILRWRKDKPADEADDLETLAGLLPASGEDSFADQSRNGGAGPA
ncbi:MAG: ATP-dependent DNA ligase [Phycisphaeraceae bacterium]|nr:ATP-dependent DNA ligase [Phycisphaeraceae bacterium]